MKAHTEYMVLHTAQRRELVHLTPKLEPILQRSGVSEGFMLVSAMHVHGRVFVNDDESGLHADIWEWLEKLAPIGEDYRHHRTGEDNGDAHLKSLLVHHEVIVPITKGQLDLGPWQRVFPAPSSTASGTSGSSSRYSAREAAGAGGPLGAAARRAPCSVRQTLPGGLRRGGSERASDRAHASDFARTEDDVLEWMAAADPRLALRNGAKANEAVLARLGTDAVLAEDAAAQIRGGALDLFAFRARGRALDEAASTS